MYSDLLRPSPPKKTLVTCLAAMTQKFSKKLLEEDNKNKTVANLEHSLDDPERKYQIHRVPGRGWRERRQHCRARYAVTDEFYAAQLGAQHTADQLCGDVTVEKRAEHSAA